MGSHFPGEQHKKELLLQAQHNIRQLRDRKRSSVAFFFAKMGSKTTYCTIRSHSYCLERISALENSRHIREESGIPVCHVSNRTSPVPCPIAFRPVSNNQQAISSGDWLDTIFSLVAEWEEENGHLHRLVSALRSRVCCAPPPTCVHESRRPCLCCPKQQEVTNSIAQPKTQVHHRPKRNRRHFPCVPFQWLCATWNVQETTGLALKAQFQADYSE